MCPEPLTLELVQALYKEIPPLFNARIEPKASSELMRTCGEWLERLNIQSCDVFLNDYVTTIPTWEGEEDAVIYTPFFPGIEIGCWSLLDQVLNLPHELIHVRQIQRDGKLEFCVSYLASDIWRTLYESQAYATAFEVGPLLNFKPTPRYLANKLVGYDCSAASIEIAYEILKSWETTTQRGGIINEPSQVVALWLKARCPECLYQEI